MDLPDLLSGDPRLRSLAQALADGMSVAARGSVGSSTHLIAGATARAAGRTVLLVLAHADEADEAHDELAPVLPAVRFPALEQLPGEASPSLDLLADRLFAVREAPGWTPGEPRVVLAPIAALMQAIHDPAEIGALWRRVARGEDHDPGEVIAWLAHAGYTRVEAVEEPGEFAVRGGIVDVFPPALNSGVPLRLDFFGSRLETIHEIDPGTMGSDRAIPRADLLAAKPEAAVRAPSDRSFLGVLDPSTIVILHEAAEIAEQSRGYYERVTEGKGIFSPASVFSALRGRFAGVAEINQFSMDAPEAQRRIDLPVSAAPTFARELPAAVDELRGLAADPCTRIEVFCQNEGERSRLGELLGGEARAGVHEGYLHRGFAWTDPPDALHPEGVRRVFIPYHEFVHRYHARRRGAGTGLRAGRALDTFLEFLPGDYVVHAEHGIARFEGIRSMRPKRARGGEAGEPEEFLTLSFAGASKLHVPLVQIDQVQRYIGGFAGRPPLSTLGGQKWKTQKDRVRESVRDLAAQMLRVRAAREHMPGIRYPDDTPWQREFEAEFPYDETPDQLAAMGEIKRDMQRERPMDRLICGDVGFGKTELAIRAAFKAVEAGRQVAVLVPTTVLAEQHERTFRSRFAGYPFRVESISRFKTPAEANRTLAALRLGKVDVIIGTHRLLSRDVRFADLGLVVVDEEQRFGVEHKERLLQLRLTVDVLTLSATPIPRTLHMAMLGLRDISSLTTPPLDRRAIVTEVIPYDERRVAQAIARELNREGQVFYVHNRVHNIRAVAAGVQSLAPEARIVVGHGQMPAGELEDVMLRFMRREADILVSTTIVESGIDIPTANTMIINDADRFGLADLHQLRGRVGRFKHRAYCYLLLPRSRTITPVAMKRLKAIEQYAMLGAGFKIAMRDLEIRGAGNLLGEEQSGHIAAVGYDMYCRLLEGAVQELQTGRAREPVSTTAIEIGSAGSFSRAYIPSDARRMEAYRRLAAAQSRDEVLALERDLTSAYGEPPPAARRLLELGELRALASALGVRSIALDPPDVIFRLPDPTGLVDAMRGASGTVTALKPKSNDTLCEVYYRPPSAYLQGETLLRVLRSRLAREPVPARTT